MFRMATQIGPFHAMPIAEVGRLTEWWMRSHMIIPVVAIVTAAGAVIATFGLWYFGPVRETMTAKSCTTVTGLRSLAKRGG